MPGGDDAVPWSADAVPADGDPLPTNNDAVSAGPDAVPGRARERNSNAVSGGGDAVWRCEQLTDAVPLRWQSNAVSGRTNAMPGDFDSVPGRGDGLPDDPEPDTVPGGRDAVSGGSRKRDGHAMSARRDAVPGRFADAVPVRGKRNGMPGATDALPAVADQVPAGADPLSNNSDAVPADADDLSGCGDRVRAPAGGDYVRRARDGIRVREPTGREALPGGQHDRSKQGDEGGDRQRNGTDSHGGSTEMVSEYALDPAARGFGARGGRAG